MAISDISSVSPYFGNNEKLLRAEDVARLLEVSVSFVYKLVSKKLIAAVRIGKAVRISHKELLNFIHNFTEPAEHTNDH